MNPEYFSPEYLSNISWPKLPKRVMRAGRIIGSIAALLALATLARAQALPRLAPDAVIVRLEQRNAERQERLRSYVSVRRYSANTPRLHKNGYMTVELRYDSPATKTYRVLEKGGSGSIHSRVFNPLLKTEVEQAGPQAREATDVTRHNYTFTFAYFDETAKAYVFDVAPLTANKYLFRGKMWVDAADFAVQRIDGEPAQRPSFWIKKTHFVREYAKYGDFWFPVRHRTQVDVRILGAATMDIDYSNYSWEPGHQAQASSVTQQAPPQ
jgi:hypothetical protein